MIFNTKVVWVLNLTPDSFSWDWIYLNEDILTKKIQDMVSSKVDIIDVWAESTAPWSKEISLEEELKRLEVFFNVIQKFPEICFSLDTMKSKIAEIWIQKWVKMINDVSAWRYDKNMLKLISKNKSIKYVLMYSRRENWRADLEQNIDNKDILEKIFEFFDESLENCLKSWIDKSQIILDTWMWAFISSDFNDSVKVLQNLNLIKIRYNLPVYIWTSRKWFLKNLSDDNWPKDRLWSSLASSLFGVLNWADYIRVHDFRETKQFIETWNFLQNNK